MKQNSSVGIFFVRILFVIFLFGFTHVATEAGSNLLVIGDSIAVGVAPQLSPGKTSAREGASSGAIANFDGTGNFTQMVISAGSNDPTSANLATNLRAIRAKQPNARTVWILPYNSQAKATVRSVASSFGDATVDLSNFPAAERGTPIHPQNYRTVATAIQSLLNNSATAPTPNSPTPTPSVTAGSGQYSGLIPCGRSTGAASEPCTACHAVVGAKRLMDYLTSIMVVVAIAVIVAMGVLYILSGVNVDLKKKSKSGITAVFVGLVLMLSAWLIVSTVLRFMANEQFIQGGAGFIGLSPGDGVYGLQCNTHSDARTAALVPGTGIVANGGSSSSSGTGTCRAPASGPCSTASLASTCFGGSHVDTWSAICYAESNGSVTVPSSTDRCTGDGNPVSFGLFQINISANRVAGLNCPSAFSSPYSGSNKNCRVVNQALYNQCVAAAKNAQNNINTACSLAGSGATNTGPWGAARRCNIPRSL